MRILITGASGFAGSHLVEALLARGYAASDIYGTVFGNPGYIGQFLPSENLISVNLTDRQATMDLVEKVKPDWVFHLAAFAFVGESFNRAAELMQNNMVLQINMLDAVRTFVPQARMLVIGSAEEYGLTDPKDLPIREDHPLHPVNPYAVSKVAQDLLAYSYQMSYGLQIVRVRPFNHIGERQSPEFAIPAFAKQVVAIERGQQESLRVGSLEGVRDFTDVKDMVVAYIILMEKGTVGEVYNIGSEKGVKMQEVVDQLLSLSTKKITLEVDQSRMRPRDVPVIIADASKVKALGWEAKIPLHETLKRVIEYWRGI